MARKHYTPAQKAAIVLELFKEEETLPQIASRHGIHPNLLRKWKAQALEELPKLFTDGKQDKRGLEDWPADHPVSLAQKKIWPRTWPALSAWRWSSTINRT
jgi:transposase-like protein